MIVEPFCGGVDMWHSFWSEWPFCNGIESTVKQRDGGMCSIPKLSELLWPINPLVDDYGDTVCVIFVGKLSKRLSI